MMRVSGDTAYNWRGKLVLTLDTPEHGRVRIPVSEVCIRPRTDTAYTVWDVRAMGSIGPQIREDCPASREMVDRWWYATEPHKNYKPLKPMKW